MSTASESWYLNNDTCLQCFKTDEISVAQLSVSEAKGQYAVGLQMPILALLLTS